MHKKMERPTVIAGKVMWNAAVSAYCHLERSRTDEGIEWPLSEGTASLSRGPRYGITASARCAPKLAAIPALPPAGSGAGRLLIGPVRSGPGYRNQEEWNGSVLRPAGSNGPGRRIHAYVRDPGYRALLMRASESRHRPASTTDSASTAQK